MRNLIIVFISILLLGSGLMAQDTADDSFNSISRDRVILELNYAGWDQNPQMPDSISTRWYNRSFNAYMMWDIPLGEQKEKSRFAFAPGLGFSNHNIYSNGRIDRDRDEESETYNQTIFRLIPDSLDVRNNKLATTYLEAPFEFRFRSKPDKLSNSWKVAIGMRVGYLLVANAKYRGQEVNIHGEINSVKTKDLVIPNISRFRFGPSLRIGYGNVSLVGYMSLSSLFERNLGPDIKPFSIGISFNSF